MLLKIHINPRVGMSLLDYKDLYIHSVRYKSSLPCCYIIDDSHFEYIEVQGCGWEDDSRSDKQENCINFIQQAGCLNVNTNKAINKTIKSFIKWCKLDTTNRIVR